MTSLVYLSIFINREEAIEEMNIFSNFSVLGLFSYVLNYKTKEQRNNMKHKNNSCLQLVDEDRVNFASKSKILETRK